MQNPPPGPPPGQPGPPPGQQPHMQPQPQPQMQPAARSGGIDRKTGAALIYGLTWVGGLLGLFVFGKDDPELKWHGARSLVLWLPLMILTWILGLIFGFIPVVKYIVPLLLDIVLVVTWIYCLYKAWTTAGSRFSIPGFGPIVDPYADRFAASVN
ncbi:MAG TPA: hypothetical protein VF160_14095 [Candidatus Dormibacteraeota bacterium]